MTIPEFLAETRPIPFEWGRHDCVLRSADLVERMSGHDPARGFRGSYDSWASCRIVLMEQGGLLALCRKQMAGFAPRETENGVCVARVNGRMICGILSGGRLFLKTARGEYSPPAGQFEIIEGWSLCRSC